MNLTRRQLLFGAVAAVATAIAGPVASAPTVVTLPPVTKPLHPLFAGEVGAFMGVRWIDPVDMLVEIHPPAIRDALNEGYYARRIVWPQRWPRGIP